MSRRPTQIGERKRLLLLLVVVVVPILTLVQEVLWEPVRGSLQEKLSNPWLSGLLLLTVVIAGAVLSHWLLEERQEIRSSLFDVEWHREQRRRLLNRLSQSYTGYLEQSLEHTVRLELGLDQVPTKVFRSGISRILPSARREERLPEGISLLQVFDEAGQLEGDGILILGGPGAGKTTLLTELAAQLTARARADPKHPIPIYLPLSTWAVRRPRLADWLVNQLNELYQVPHPLSRSWLGSSQLLFLLDGLDEISDPATRYACAEEINRFNRDYPLPIAICSRELEYDALRVRLQLHTAVLIRALDPQEVLDRLRQAGPRMAAVVAVVQRDPELQHLLRSPLLVSMLAVAYADTSEAAIRVTSGSPAGHRHQLIADYVNRQFELEREQQANRLSEDPTNIYPVERTLQWLSSLARNLNLHHQTVFVLGNMRSDWLPRALPRFLVRLAPLVAWGVSYGIIDWVFYNRLAPALGLPGGVSLIWVVVAWPAFGVVVGIVNERRLGLHYRLATWMAFGLLVTLLVSARETSSPSPPVSFLVSTTGNLVYFVLAGEAAVRLIAGELPLAERLEWSWKRAQRSITLGLSVGLILGLVLGVVFSRTASILGGFNSSHVLLERMAYGTAIGFVWGVGLGVAGGLRVASIPRYVRPNEGLRKSIYYGVVMGSASMLVIALLLVIVGLVFGTHPRLTAGRVLLWAPFIGVPWALHSGLGAALQQLMLRVLLWRYRMAPLRFVRWLNYVVRLRLLYWGIGGGYAFIHRTVEDYFSATDHLPADDLQTA